MRLPTHRVDEVRGCTFRCFGVSLNSLYRTFGFICVFLFRKIKLPWHIFSFRSLGDIARHIILYFLLYQFTLSIISPLALPFLNFRYRTLSWTLSIFTDLPVRNQLSCRKVFWRPLCPLLSVHERTGGSILNWWQSWSQETAGPLAGWVITSALLAYHLPPHVLNSPVYFIWSKIIWCAFLYNNRRYRVTEPFLLDPTLMSEGCWKLFAHW